MTVTVLAIAFAAIGLVLLVAGVSALFRRRLFGMTLRLISAFLFLALGTLMGSIGVAVQGYHAFTREEVAATVRTEPLGEQRFKAHFRFPDGREQLFMLAGDELYVDAHVLKWKPVGNFVGLHTAYELDRVAGRYRGLGDERGRERTVHSLAPDRRVDLFTLRRRYAWLAPLLDAEYGSATFASVAEPAHFELRISTSGLLIRHLDAGAASPSN